MEHTEETTDDTLLGGQVRLRQPKRGYRASLEAPLLAAFALGTRRKWPRHLVDLGAGVGSVGLCAAYFEPRARVTLVEDEALAAHLARHNVEANGLGARATVVEASVTGVDVLVGRGSADLVLMNPPWFDPRGGHIAPDPRRARARTLSDAGLDPFLQAGRQLLARGGRLAIAFPATSLPFLFCSLELAGLVPKRMVFLHGRVSRPADVVLVEAMPAKPGGLQVLAPWIVRSAGEEYTPAIASILQGSWRPPQKFPREGLRRTPRGLPLRPRFALPLPSRRRGRVG